MEHMFVCVCVCGFGTCVYEYMGACSAAFGIFDSDSVCVMCMTSLSEGAFGGYANTEEGYLYFEEMMVVSVRSGLI